MAQLLSNVHHRLVQYKERVFYFILTHWFEIDSFLFIFGFSDLLINRGPIRGISTRTRHPFFGRIILIK